MNQLGSGPYAHTGPGSWESLPDHARAVADLAAASAAAFGAADWGRLLGLWHDLGKRSAEFQAYLRTASAPSDAGEADARPGGGTVDHSTFGAQHAARTVPNRLGQLLAFCIAGHHAGLMDSTYIGRLPVRATFADTRPMFAERF